MGTKKKSSNWRVLKNGPVFAIVNERTEPDLIADVYSNQTDALTMAASRELREACEELLKADCPGKWGVAWIKMQKAVELAKRGAK